MGPFFRLEILFSGFFSLYFILPITWVLRYENIRKMKKIINELKEKLGNDPNWEIIEEDAVYYVVDVNYREYYRINVGMREKFPQALFKGPEYDDCIMGINPITKVVYYDCLEIGARHYHIYSGQPDFENCIEGLLNEMDYLAEMKGENQPVFIFPAGHTKEFWTRFVETMEGFSDGRVKL